MNSSTFRWKGGKVAGPECGITLSEGDHEALKKVLNGFSW